MKRLSVLIILSCIFLSANLKAQSGFHAGIHAGYNVVGIFDPETYGAPDYEYKPKYGFLVGAALGYDFVSFIGIQTELNYAKMGHDVKKDYPSGESILREIDFDYIQIPLMAKVRLGGGDVRYYLLFGPQFSFLTKASIYSTETAEVVTDAIENGNFKKNDFGLSLGTGADILLVDNLFINAGLRFYYGLSDINTDDPAFWQNKTKINEFSNNGYGGLDVGIHYYF